MAERDPAPGRAFARIFVVIALTAIALAASLPDLSRVWSDSLGDLGLVSDLDGFVTSVDPEGSSAAAGVRVGDRIDVHTTDLRTLVCAVPDSFYAPVGAIANLGIIRGDKRLRALVVARPEQRIDRPIVLIREIVGVFFLAIGAWLVLSRPSTTTWLFFVTCLGFSTAPVSLFLAYGPLWLVVPEIFYASLLYQVSAIAAVLFALHLARDEVTGWRLTFQRACIWLGLALVAASIYWNIGSMFTGARTAIVSDAVTKVSIAAAVATIALLLDNYVHASGKTREQVKWVILGFTIAMAASAIDAYVYPQHAAYWVHGVLLSLFAAIPLSVAYAIARHRLLEVSFVINRALVYALITSIVVALFAALDWIFTHEIVNPQLGYATSIAVAIGVGFGFNGLHGWVDRLVDNVFFRSKHIAEERLAFAASALPHARSQTAVAQLLLDEPLDALRLASAALFEQSPLGYVRRQSIGWTAASLHQLSEDDVLVAHLHARQAALDLHRVRWDHPDVPDGDAKPALALPVIVRNNVLAIVLYGNHAGGEDLDPDERNALASLGPGAGAAYDHLAAEALRVQNEEFRARLALLEARQA